MRQRSEAHETLQFHVQRSAGHERRMSATVLQQAAAHGSTAVATPSPAGVDSRCSESAVRVGVVLSAGGLRGAAHVGVLRQLVQHGVPIDILVGVSAGAIIGAYYAAVGLTFDELVADAATFRGRHLLAHSLKVHLDNRVGRAMESRSGVIPVRLRQLEAARFDRLHHDVRALGIVCHDLTSARPLYFGSGLDAGPALHEIVKASASIPHLFPPVEVVSGGQSCRLTDGGISDSVPIAFARALGATHLIVSDCRWLGGVRPTDANTVWIRPRMASTGTLWSPRHGLLPAVRSGEAAVDRSALSRIGRWLSEKVVGFERFEEF
jgi:NTE family protein